MDSFVHDGDRTNNRQTHPFPKPPFGLAPGVDEQQAAPVSALRLAAEAAFEAPQLRPLPPSQARVTLRKTRVLEFAAAPAVADHVESAAEPGRKAPRVFRLESAPATHARSVASVSSVPPRSRRVAADKRPGPMLHVVHELPPGTGIEATQMQLNALLAQLASVEPVLDAIRRAQSLEIVDPRADLEWQRLARVAEDIGRELMASR